MTEWWRGLACAALLCLPGEAAADPVSLRLAPVSGDGSRLALDMVPPSGWTVQQFEDLVEIRFPGLSAEIALPTAIRPPVAELATEIRGGDTFLRMIVECACAIAVSVQGTDRLMLELVVRGGDRLTRPDPQRAPMPAARHQVAGARTPAGLDVDEVRERLMAQLVRAAEAGLIELDGVDAAQAGEHEAPETTPGVAASPAGDALDGAGHVPDPPLEDAGASPDRATEIAASETASPDDGGGDGGDAGERTAGAGSEVPPSEAEKAAPTCHPDDLYKLPVLARGELAARIADLRTGLAGEFDRADPAAAGDLARTYLGAGFAEEALSVLEQFGDGLPEITALQDVARIMIGREPVPGASVWRQDCLGAQALWRASALAARGDGHGAIQAEEASGRALEQLPPGLRRDAAARLGLAAADAGEWTTARRMRAMAGRSDPAAARPPGRELLLEARLARWEGNAPATLSALSRARGGEPDVAAAATLQLAQDIVNSGDARRQGVAGLIADLGVLARLARGTPEGTRAAELEARLVDMARGREAALEVMTTGLGTGDLPEADFTRLLSSLAEGDGTRDGSIASIYLDDPEAFGPALEDRRFRTLLARSLIDLDLPAQAAGLFADGQIPDTLVADLAAGYLHVGDHRAAVPVIARLPDTPVRAALHARALALAGGAPAGVLADGTAPPERLVVLARAALAAGDLSRALDLTLARLEHDPTPAIAETAALIAFALGAPAIPPAADSLLASADAATHARLAALFERTVRAKPDDPPTAEDYLNRLDAEIAIIEGMLDDG